MSLVLIITFGQPLQKLTVHHGNRCLKCAQLSHTRSISVIALENLFSNLRILITFSTSCARKLFRCDDIPCISWTTAQALWKIAQPHLLQSCLSKITHGIISMQDKISWTFCYFELSRNCAGLETARYPRIHLTAHQLCWVQSEVS